MATMKYSFSSTEFPGELVIFIEKELTALKVDKKLRIQAMLLSEEVLVKLREHATSDDVKVEVRKRLGDLYIEISAPGEEFDVKEIVGSASIDSLDEMDDTEDSIRDIILHAYGERLKYRNRYKVNNVSIAVGETDKKSIYYTVISLIASIVVGLLFNLLVPVKVNTALCNYLFTPIKTMFINSLKMVIAPIIFFSIATCLSQFSDIKELGRIGGKVMGMYLCTTVFAILVGFGTFFIFSPGTLGSLSYDAAEVAAPEQTDVVQTVVDSIVDVVPSNFLAPFVNSNTLQVIFLAVVAGLAVGYTGIYSNAIKQLFEACNSLFLSIVTMISKLIPIVVFASIFVIIIQTGTDSLIDVFAFAGTYLVGAFAMMCVYSMLILIIARLNPLKFFKKNARGMLTAFTLSSSNAAMPTNLDICENSMGISKKVCSFSIPLGATVNMDGLCVYLAIAGLFLAKMYGITISGSEIAYIIFTIVILSISSPGVPGVNMVCLTVLLGVIGVPIEGLGLLMGIDALLDMTRTVSNTTGDIAVTLIVARSENLVDLEKWK